MKALLKFFGFVILTELVIAYMYRFARCYSPFTGEPNFFARYMCEINVILLLVTLGIAGIVLASNKIRTLLQN
jgi:hypothetical protein